MRLIVAGGGTGGHLYPGVAVAEELLARGGDHKVLFVGSAKGIEATLLPRLKFDFTPVKCGQFVGKGLSAFKGLMASLSGVTESGEIIKNFQPDACLGVGGYASFPMVLACGLKGVPSMIQEQNAFPGLTNKALGKLVRRVYASDASAGRAFSAHKVLVTGTPLRKKLAGAFPYDAPAVGKPLRLLVLGGSQGAKALNEIVPKAVGLLTSPVEVRHQAGKGKDEPVIAAYAGRPGVKVTPFIDDMDEAYAWSQIVVARAGAMTLAELASAGRPAILVPFPYSAGDHQTANALSAERKNTALCIREKELTPEKLARILEDWAKNPDLPAIMAKNSADSAIRDSARRIVDDMLAVACGKMENK